MLATTSLSASGSGERSRDTSPSAKRSCDGIVDGGAINAFVKSPRVLIIRQLVRRQRLRSTRGDGFAAKMVPLPRRALAKYWRNPRAKSRDRNRRSAMTRRLRYTRPDAGSGFTTDYAPITRPGTRDCSGGALGIDAALANLDIVIPSVAATAAADSGAVSRRLCCICIASSNPNALVA